MTNFDVYENEIKEGDWLVLASSSSNMPPFRFAKIAKFGSTGKPMASVFEFFREDSGNTWGQAGRVLITLSASSKSWLIDESSLPEGLKNFIRDQYGGDPLFKIKKK